MTPRKKLIEVALPLEAINREAAREKSIRHGHPSTLHLWWARRPLAACRAVLFASLVDDPGSLPELFPTETAQEQERQRLFRIIEELVKWENSTNEDVLHAARTEIARSVARTAGVTLPNRKLTPAEVAEALKQHAPPVLDPFCGGGSIPLEAQRLGLEAHGSDLNPVAVLITKALIEIPPKFAGQAPVNPEARAKLVRGGEWPGATGLAEDVRYYGKWMRDEAEKRIGHLYPKVTLPKEQGGGEATVIAWLWARTVTCPNPACGARMPLVRSFELSKKPGARAWVVPVVDRATTPPAIRFTVQSGAGAAPEGTVGRRGATCLACRVPVELAHVRVEGRAKRMGAQLMAVVAEGARGRVYLPPNVEHEETARRAKPKWVPETEMPEQALGFRVQGYGMTCHADLFTPRQLVALTTFSDLVGEVREGARHDAVAGGLPDDGVPLDGCGTGATAYVDGVATYLAFPVDRAVDYWSSIATWHTGNQQVRCTFARQALPMTWDFVEPNPFSRSSGGWLSLYASTVEAIGSSPIGVRGGRVEANSASVAVTERSGILVSTDPPYYDNVPYADLSDVFYVWLRRALSAVHPDLFTTRVTPKLEELVADPTRHGGADLARTFFEAGMRQVFARTREAVAQNYPASIFYAFKQAEADSDEMAAADDRVSFASTGWETMLAGLLVSGWQVMGTWPMQSEQHHRMRAHSSNALASSIVLVCRPREAGAGTVTRREFLGALRDELPDALLAMMHGNIAPVDLAQAVIGPGMAVFSRYARVLEADGTPMSVRTALGLINQALDEVLAEHEGEFDAETRWALTWFEQHGMEAGPYGTAETLATARNVAVQGMVQSGILEARASRVRLLRREEMPETWDPATDPRLPEWEVTQRLIRALDAGEAVAARMVRQVGAKAEAARDLAYRLYTVCERKGWATEAQAYNRLVTSWPEITRLAQQAEAPAEPQGALDMGA